MEETNQLHDETDFRELLRKPSKLFGYSYVYFFFALVALGTYYASKLNEIGKMSVIPLVADSTRLVTDIPYKSSYQIPPVDAMKAGVPSDSLIARGKILFKTNCASCHGDDGQGDGPAAHTMNPKPRIFRSASGWTNGTKVSEMFKTLEEGIVRNNMPSYNYVPAIDRFALIHYVRSLVSGASVDSAADLQQLESIYKLSQGRISPGQIPIRKAALLMAVESAPIVGSVEIGAKKISSEQDSCTSLFSRVAGSPVKVLVALQAMGSATNFDEFVQRVSANPLEMGFLPRVNQLSAQEWKVLYEYLRSNEQSIVEND